MNTQWAQTLFGTALAVLAVIGCPSSHGRPVSDADSRPDDSTGEGGTDGGHIDSGSADSPARCVPVSPGNPQPLLPSFTFRIERADVVLLTDVTSSMTGELETLRSEAAEVLFPALRETAEDTHLGAAIFGDLQSDPLYEVLFKTTDAPSAIEEGMRSASGLAGGDGPEGQVLALWLTATENEIRREAVFRPSCAPGRTAHPCFRSNAVPIVLLFTDAPFHEGPMGAFPYEGTLGYSIRYEDAVAVLRASGVRVLGVYTGSEGQPGLAHLRALASDTGAVDAEGEPIVEMAGPNGEGLSERTLTAFQTLVYETPYDVTLRAKDGAGDEIDATRLVASINAVSSHPAHAATAREGGFEAVAPSTHLVFEVQWDPSALDRRVCSRGCRLSFVLETEAGQELEERVVSVVADRTDCM